jgi:hypothetical protein
MPSRASKHGAHLVGCMNFPATWLRRRVATGSEVDSREWRTYKDLTMPRDVHRQPGIRGLQRGGARDPNSPEAGGSARASVIYGQWRPRRCANTRGNEPIHNAALLVGPDCRKGPCLQPGLGPYAREPRRIPVTRFRQSSASGPPCFSLIQPGRRSTRSAPASVCGSPCSLTPSH